MFGKYIFLGWSYGGWLKWNIKSQEPIISTPRKQEEQIIHSPKLNHTFKKHIQQHQKDTLIPWKPYWPAFKFILTKVYWFLEENHQETKRYSNVMSIFEQYIFTMLANIKKQSVSIFHAEIMSNLKQ